MILIDTSVIAAWLDETHEHHAACCRSLEYWAGTDSLAISAVTFAELASAGRTREAVEAALVNFERIELDAQAAWRAGAAFRRAHPESTGRKPVLPDFFIRAQAAVLDCRHLTNDRRRLAAFSEVDYIFPE